MKNFTYKKKYGQNFLNDEKTIDKIVNSINPSDKDIIIEIGPGSGALTKKLKKYNSHLIAFEIDKETEQFLKKLEDQKTKILYEDFLNVDLYEIIKKVQYEKLFIIGNLPYYITTPIIEKIIDSKIKPESITIMVQKEVADRFLAKPSTKQYGYMTVLINFNFNLEKICDVPKTFFTPSPKVDSTVIKLNKKDLPNTDYQKFKNLLKESFQFKRKTIQNNLKNYDQKKLENILINRGFSLTSRAEMLDLETFLILTNNLSKK